MTIGSYFEMIAGVNWNAAALLWPPDMFALCASALQKSGGYIEVVCSWPPAHLKSPKSWAKVAKRVGLAWRSQCIDKKYPREVREAWKKVFTARKTTMRSLCASENRELCQALLELCAYADEACIETGLPGRADPFEAEIKRVFVKQYVERGRISTICKSIPPDTIAVLPKLLTPQKGVTIRSISHYLALCPVGEAKPSWEIIPTDLHTKKVEWLNLLLIPWPQVVSPTHFKKLKKNCPLRHISPDRGFFSYSIRGGSPFPLATLEKILCKSTSHVGGIQGVVFPELALHESDVNSVWSLLSKKLPGAFLIAGVGSQQGGGFFAENGVMSIFRGPVLDKPQTTYQNKHHRWMLDPSQIRQYGLTERLGSGRYWENAQLKDRDLKFLPLTESLILCSLICEDLGRPDPIADLVRAVGPNLVVALLMDGPQLAHRWAARYASVLAEDPGCSVLSLTSIGMARLSKALGRPESRVVALWKDPFKGPFEIDLPYDAEALVLSLTLALNEEWTADGRSDGRTTGRWVLDSVHPVRLSDP